MAYAQRSRHQSFILSGDFDPESYLLISRFLKYAKEIYLTGTLSLKFRMASRSIKQVGNIQLSDKETALINEVLSKS